MAFSRLISLSLAAISFSQLCGPLRISQPKPAASSAQASSERRRDAQAAEAKRAVLQRKRLQKERLRIVAEEQRRKTEERDAALEEENPIGNGHDMRLDLVAGSDLDPTGPGVYNNIHVSKAVFNSALSRLSRPPPPSPRTHQQTLTFHVL